jgi:hypothetical protein
MKALMVALIVTGIAAGAFADVTHKPMRGLKDNLEWAKEQSRANDLPMTTPKAGRAESPVAVGLTEVGLPGITVDVLALVDDLKTWEAPVNESHVVEIIRHRDGDMYADATDGISDAPQVQAYDKSTELGFWGRRWAWMKDHPMLTGASVIGTGAGVYYIGEKQGWWGSSGRSNSPGDDSFTANGINVTIGDGNSGVSVIVQQPAGSGTGSSPVSNTGSGGLSQIAP